MVEATPTLAQAYSKPERTRREGNITYIQTQFATRVRSAIISLAKREAQEAIKRKLRTEGKVRVTLLSASEINKLAAGRGPSFRAEYSQAVWCTRNTRSRNSYI